MAVNDGPHSERSPLLAAANDSAEQIHTVENQSSEDKAGQYVTWIRIALITVSLGVLLFLQAMNFSLLTTTQSAIADDLDAYAEASWFTSAYLIAMSSTTPLAGRLSQIFSARTCMFISTLIFAFGTFISAVAPALGMFLVGRAITGIGAAGLFSVSMILVLELTNGKQRGLYVGLVNSGYTVGVAFGAVIAGALAPRIGWRAVFWIQSPIALVMGVCIFLSIHPSMSSGSPGLNGDRKLSSQLARIDYLGISTLTSSLVLFLASLASPRILIIPIVLSVLLLVAFVFVETRIASEPIIPVSVLKSRGALLSCLSTLGLMIARWTVLFYSPVYAIAVRNWNAPSAGSILIPTNGGFALGGLLAGWIHIRRAGSFYLACLITFILFPISLFILSHISTPQASAWVYLLILFINGLTTGAALNYTLAHLLHLTLPSTHFIATALLATFRGFAGSFGSAIGGGLFTRTLKLTLVNEFARRGLRNEDELVRRLLGSPATVGGLVGAEREVAVAGYVQALYTIFIAGTGLSILMIVIQACTGWTAPEAEGEPIPGEVSGEYEDA